MFGNDIFTRVKRSENKKMAEIAQFLHDERPQRIVICHVQLHACVAQLTFYSNLPLLTGLVRQCGICLLYIEIVAE
mgnify:CR=1 FL=1